MNNSNTQNILDNRMDEPLLTWRMAVLTLILAVSTLLEASIFSPIIVVTGLLLLSFNRKIKVSYIYLILPLFIILILGIIGIPGHQSLHVFRDLVYALTPISLLYIGYWIAENKRMWPQILQIFVLFVILLSIIHLSQFALNPALLEEDYGVIRQKASAPEVNLLIITFMLGLFQYRLGLGNLFPKFFPRYIALPLFLLSFILTYSRTGIVVGIIFASSILGLIGRINLRTIFTTAILIGSFSIFVITTPSDEEGTYRSKIANSATEITVSDYQEMADINKNWRGFETYMAVLSFDSSSPFQKIFGQGFGALVDLGFPMLLAGTVFTEIPILHNGYAYVLVKTGILGILCYIFFYFSLLRISLKTSKSLDKEQVLLSRILLGCTLSLILSMFVIGGIAQIHDSAIVLLLGYILRRMEQLTLEI